MVSICMAVWTNIPSIGSGSFGVIRKVRRKADGFVCHFLASKLQGFGYADSLYRFSAERRLTISRCPIRSVNSSPLSSTF